jgi:DNA-binding PadR family transcriptional regulator
MPSRTDYLAAVGANPGSSAEKIHALVTHCPTVAAADTMLRKLASKGLLVAASTSPRTYSLTDKGKADLNSFSTSSAEPHARASNDSLLSRGTDTPVSSRLQRVRALLERLNAQKANESENVDQPSGDVTRGEIKPGVRELLAFERALSDLPRRDLQKHRQSLCEQIGNEEMVQKVARLAKAEAELREQKGWWGDESEAKRLESEIDELKHQLGLSEVAVRSEE